jgi:hypothetical protein
MSYLSVGQLQMNTILLVVQIKSFSECWDPLLDTIWEHTEEWETFVYSNAHCSNGVVTLNFCIKSPRYDVPWITDIIVQSLLPREKIISYISHIIGQS